MITVEFVNSVFAPFEQGDPPTFFRNSVADNVDWTIIGQDNPVQGRYTSKAELISKGMNRIVNCLVPPVKRKITNVLVSGDWAIVENTGQSTTKKGEPYNMQFCWICRFENEKIVEVRMYMDTALAKRTIEENE